MIYVKILCFSNFILTTLAVIIAIIRNKIANNIPANKNLGYGRIND